MKRKLSEKKVRAARSRRYSILKPCASGWVALSPDEREVVASAPTLEQTHREAEKKGCPHPVLLQVVPSDKGFIGVWL
jgi:hypothetical protein